jgi:hypothetical protein
MTKANAIPNVPCIKNTEECGICVSTLILVTSKYTTQTVCKPTAEPKKMKTSNMVR